MEHHDTSVRSVVVVAPEPEPVPAWARPSGVIQHPFAGHFAPLS